MGSDSAFGERADHEHDGPDCCPPRPSFRVPKDPADRKLLAEVEACNEYLRGRLQEFRGDIRRLAERMVKAEFKVVELERLLGQKQFEIDRLERELLMASLRVAVK